jgi:hypothetical protein
MAFISFSTVNEENEQDIYKYAALTAQHIKSKGKLSFTPMN